MNPKIYYLIYISTATFSFSQKDLLELLAQSRQNNTGLGITGMLLYKGRMFQQILEGAEDTVKSLYLKILPDPRHGGVIKMLDGFEAERQFSDWSMGFNDLNSAGPATVPGYSHFLNTPFSDGQFVANPGICLKLMLLFKKNSA